MVSDRWQGAGVYARFMGRWSQRVAVRFLQWLAIPPGRSWLDVGCGTGALSEQILLSQQPASLLAIDPAVTFIEYAQARLRDDRARVEQGSAEAIPAGDGSFEVVVSGLALNFMSDASTAVREMRRVAGRGATIAAYVWDYGGGMEMLRHFWDVAASLDPAAATLDQGSRFALCNADALQALFRAGGLVEVQSHALVIPTLFTSFDDYWEPFLGGTGSAPTYISTLAPASREALRERLRDTLPTRPDGSIALQARAWAVRGTVS